MSLGAKVKAFLIDYAYEFFRSEYLLSNYEKSLPDVISDADEYADMNVQLVNQFGGEGEGETYWFIVEFTSEIDNGSVFVRFNASYSSYNGAEYQDWDFVKPVQVLRTEYEVIE